MESIANFAKIISNAHSNAFATIIRYYRDRATYSIVLLLVGLLLAVSHAAHAQGVEDATALNQQVKELRSQGRYSEAVPLAQRALAIQESALGPDHPEVVLPLYNLGSLYSILGRYADAEPLLKRSLAISEKAYGLHHPIVASVVNNLAELYRLQGRDAEAESLYKRSLEIKKKAFGPSHPSVATALNNLAEVYDDQGRYSEAEPLLKQSLAIDEKAYGSDHLEVATPLLNLAALYKTQGRYGDAEPLLQRALKIREAALGRDHPDVGLLLNHIANIYSDQGLYSKAELLYKRFLIISEKAFGPDHPEVAVPLNNLAELYRAEGRYSEAEPLYKRSLTIHQKAVGPNHPNVATSLGNLAGLYREMGRYTDAEPLYKRSLIISEKSLGPNHPQTAMGLNMLAELYRLQGRYAEAEPLYKRSLDIDKTTFGPDSPQVAGVLNNIALLYHNQGRYTDAEPLYKRSLQTYTKFFGPDYPETVTILNNLAGLYKDEGHYADALPIVQSLINQNHAVKFVALDVLYGLRSQNLIAPTDALESSYIVLQHAISSAAGNAVSQLAARFAAGTNELAQLVRKDQDLSAEADRLDKNIIAAVSKPPVERNATAEGKIRKRLNEIKTERDGLQDIFNRRFPDYTALSKPPPLSIKETQALLADDEALIVFDFDVTSYAWVISTDQAEWKQLPVSADEVAKEVMALRSELEPESFKPFDAALAYKLYEQILGPVKDFISRKSRLSFVLTGALTSLPPQVLITNEPEDKPLASVNWLVRKYAITVLPSTNSLKVLRGNKTGLRAAEPMIGFGDPVFERATEITTKPKVTSLDQSLPAFYRGIIADTKLLATALPPLPETADELRSVAKKLGAKPEDIYLREAANVPNVKHAPLDNYRVVYFATHALVAGEVEKFAKVKAEPALVLSIPEKPTQGDDGLLKASDVAMLKMKADFVVLSACNTAAGDKPGAEALSGLARAFFYAGARSLIVSNWEVDSESTVALMTGLFDALGTNPHLSHAEALRLSMLQMIDNASKPEWAQPKYWAPFIVVGEPQKS
jgi:CHAT domain-containing protein/Tfp pilus assembly protein PilF